MVSRIGMISILLLACLPAGRGLAAGAQAPAWQVKISVRPEQLHLAREHSAAVDVTIRDGSGGPVSGVRFEILARAGSVSLPRELGPGRYRAEYTAPASKFPQIEFLVARSRAGVLGWTVFPLVGSGKVEVDTDPGASVELQVAQSSFGPVRADSQGRASIAFEAPPGVTHGQLLARAGRSEGSRRSIDLGVPLVDPVMLVPEKGELVTGDHRPGVINAFCVGADGTPLVSPAPEFSASRGKLGPVQKVADGWFRVPLWPPRLVGDGNLEVRSRLALGKQSYTQKLHMKLKPGPPARIEVEAGHHRLQVGSGAVPVRIAVFDANGNQLADTTPVARAECGKIEQPRWQPGRGFLLLVFPPRAAGDCKQVKVEISLPRPGDKSLVKQLAFDLLPLPDKEPATTSPAPRVVEKLKVVEKPVPRPRSRLRPWAWTALGAGLAALVPGVVLLALDGKETCSAPDPVRCPEVYDTRTGGIVFTSLGAALVAGGVVLHWLAWRRESVATAPAVTLLPAAGGLLVGAKFSF